MMRRVPENVARISVPFHCDHFFFCGGACFTLYRSSRASRCSRKMSKMKQKNVLRCGVMLSWMIMKWCFAKTRFVVPNKQLISQSSRIEPARPQTTSKIQQNIHMWQPCRHCCCLLSSETFPSAVTVCLRVCFVVFQFLSWVLSSALRRFVSDHINHTTLYRIIQHHITSHNTPSHPFVSHDIALHIPHHTTPHLATSPSLPPHVTSPPNAWHRTTLSHGASQHHRHHHQHTRETPANNITTRNRWTPVHTKISVWAAHWLVALVVGPAAVRTFH